MKVLVDTSALYALMVAEDMNHQAAVSCFEQLRLAAAGLLSTNYVLLECASLIQRRHGFQAAQMLLTKAATLLDVAWIGQEEHGQAVALWVKAGSRALSLVDCASFAVMRKQGIQHAVAFDPHFAQAGFEVLPADDRVAEPQAVYRPRLGRQRRKAAR